MRRRDGTTAQDAEVRAFYATLGALVKAARQAASVTQDALAEDLGLTRASVANLEAGRQRVPVHTLVAAATALGCPVESLIPARAPDTQAGPRNIPRNTPPEHIELVKKLMGSPDE